MKNLKHLDRYEWTGVICGALLVSIITSLRMGWIV